MNKYLLSSQLIGRKLSKMALYISTIRPIAIYTAETWTLTESNINYLMIFERLILRKIFGPVHERDGWRIRTNHELNNLIGGANSEIHRSSKIAMLGTFT
jgi:hypothetical protein